MNRTHHAEYGALLAWDILRDKPLTLVERVTVISAIGNHDESTGGAKDPVSAALVLADKTDVRRNRVREKEREKFDIHDRVNFAVTGSSLKVDPEEAKISLNLQVDESICTMYEYFDIFWPVNDVAGGRREAGGQIPSHRQRRESAVIQEGKTYGNQEK